MPPLKRPLRLTMPPSTSTVITSAVFCLHIFAGLVFSATSHAQEPEPAKTETVTPATAEPATEPPTATIPDNDELLAKQSPDDQIWWLNSDTDKFLGLYIHEETGRNSYGATLILPDPGRPADWPAMTRTLRELLPKHHWHTLAINPSVSLSLLQGRIEAAIKELRSKNINNIAVIAEGKTALGALQYIETHAGEIRAIVLLNPSHQELAVASKAAQEKTTDDKEAVAEKPAEEIPAENSKGQIDKLLQSLSKLTIPCLDMATGSSIDEMELAKQRLSVSRGLQRGQYQQISLPAKNYPDNNAQENPVSKRVRGWLNKNALPPKSTEEEP